MAGDAPSVNSPAHGSLRPHGGPEAKLTGLPSSEAPSDDQSPINMEETPSSAPSAGTQCSALSMTRASPGQSAPNPRSVMGCMRQGVPSRGSMLQQKPTMQGNGGVHGSKEKIFGGPFYQGGARSAGENFFGGSPPQLMGGPLRQRKFFHGLLP